LVHFFPVLVSCTKKNLATLDVGSGGTNSRLFAGVGFINCAYLQLIGSKKPCFRNWEEKKHGLMKCTTLHIFYVAAGKTDPLKKSKLPNLRPKTASKNNRTIVVLQKKRKTFLFS
jgi:hypothetical protein